MFKKKCNINAVSFREAVKKGKISTTHNGHNVSLHFTALELDLTNYVKTIQFSYFII